jgi:predicted XRE-type DNA-binding protein
MVGFVESEASSSNVSADSERVKLIKSKLATKIVEIVEARGWTQVHAAQVIGIPASRLSMIQHGRFHSTSLVKLLECLACLGRVQIVIAPEMATSVGSIDVIFL